MACVLVLGGAWPIALYTQSIYGHVERSIHSYRDRQAYIDDYKTAFLSCDRLLMACVLVLGGARPIALYTQNVGVVYACYVPMVIALGVLNTAITTAASRLSDKDQVITNSGICKKINRSHTHTPTENNTPDTDTHTRQKQHPTPPNEHLPQTLNNARMVCTKYVSTDL